MVKGKGIPWFMVVFFLTGVIVSLFLMATETNIIFKKDQFTKQIIIDSDQKDDAGYVILKRNEKTPSIIEYVRFGNNETFMFFTISDEDILWEKVYFDIPELERGRYYIDYEIVFKSGKIEKKTISFLSS